MPSVSAIFLGLKVGAEILLQQDSRAGSGVAATLPNRVAILARSAKITFKEVFHARHSQGSFSTCNEMTAQLDRRAVASRVPRMPLPELTRAVGVFPTRRGDIPAEITDDSIGRLALLVANNAILKGGDSDAVKAAINEWFAAPNRYPAAMAELDEPLIAGVSVDEEHAALWLDLHVSWLEEDEIYELDHTIPPDWMNR